MWNFITNKEKLLKDVIENTLTTTDKLDALVWFFYFSGFEKLADKVKDKQIRILVWMDVEFGIKNTIKEIYRTQNQSNEEVKQQFLKQIKNLFNKTDILYNEKWETAVEIFLQKLQDRSLQIRKTKNPNHSKLYLFYEKEETSQNGERPWVLITGSSNLTYGGLMGQYELNARFDDKQTFHQWVEIFEKLWEDSVEILGEDLIKTIKEETWLKVYSPYLLWAKLLKEYFEINIPNIKTPAQINKNFKDLKYQVDALKRALKIIHQYNWVIIADVVGLWKSILWSAILANLGKPAILIVPPHLISAWENYAEMFDLKVKIFSWWKLEEAKEFATKYSQYKIVLVDEAHRARNDDTLAYAYLHQICQWKKVILLTATPFNNAPADIFNLIKLFQIPKKSILAGWNLYSRFIALQNHYLEIRKKLKNDENVDIEIKKISQQVRDLIFPVLIRRSRIDLEKIEEYKKDLQEQEISFPKVNDPQTIEFSLWNLENLYWETIQLFLDKDKFFYARYIPLLYLKNIKKYEEYFEKFYGYSYGLIEGRQKNMNLFITRQVVGRFESSLYSFKRTLNRLISSYENIFSWLEKYNAIPIIRKWVMPDIEEILDEDLDIEITENVEKVLAEKYNWFLLKKEDLKEDFFEKLESDYQTLLDLKSKWGNIQDDPKLESLISHLKQSLKENPKRKVVIFSSYSDTVNYLAEKLAWVWLKVLSVTWKSKTKQLKTQIKENFDAGCENPKDEFDVLVATDAISEWYNLHRAWIIINYDIPYNPTVIIQRVGRINRINKKVFDEIFIYNYFPSTKGENIVRHKTISKLKLDLIWNILWIDTKILDKTDPLWSFYKKQLDEEKQFSEEESWDAKYYDEFTKIKNNEKFYKQLDKIPNKVKVQRFLWKGFYISVFKKEDIFVFRKFENDEVENLIAQEGFALFKADEDEKFDKIEDKKFYEIYKKLVNFSQTEATKINTQLKKALDNLKIYRNYFDKDYFALLYEIVKLDVLPKFFATLFRDLDKNPEEISKQIQLILSKNYLQTLRQNIKNFEKMDFELMMVEKV